MDNLILMLPSPKTGDSRREEAAHVEEIFLNLKSFLSYLKLKGNIFFNP